MMRDLQLFSVGAIIQAQPPKDGDDSLCHLQGWFSLLPLVAILAILFGKTDRVRCDDGYPCQSASIFDPYAV